MLQLNCMQLKLAAKRAVDITVAGLLLVLTMPVILIAAFAIKLESTGPVIFRQIRIGKDKGAFNFYKFRSMYTGADESAHREYIKKLMSSSLPSNDGREPVYKLVLDSRVTCVGKFIRKTSIDELPQLFNVLKGEMSMVGPRPAVPYELEYYTPDMFKRFSVKPGITGLW